MPEPLLPPSQQLCRHCGLCCDGTLFSRAGLKDGDTADQLKLAGFTVIDVRGKRSFAMRCIHHHGDCTIYDRWRPGICGRFECRLLKRLNAGEISLDEALSCVDRARRHADEVRAEMGGADSNQARNLFELATAWTDRVPPGPASAQVALNHAALTLRLNRDFRGFGGRKDSAAQMSVPMTTSDQE